jgi:hypothetical protein
MVSQQFISKDGRVTFPLILFLGIGMLFALIWYGEFHALPLMQADSLSYIEFSPVRTAGYPFFLWIVKKVFGTFDVVPVLQLCFLALSATYLAAGLYRLTGRYFLPSVLMVGLMVNPVYHYAFTIMTESLSISILMIFLGIVIRLLHQPTLTKLALLSIIVGVGILIRPVHYAYIPLLLGIGLWALTSLPFRFFPVVAATLTPLIVLVLLGCWGQYEKNGTFRLESMNGFNMIGKVSLIADKNISGRYPSFLKEVAEFAAPVQEYLDQTPNLHIRYLLSAPYYDYFRYKYLPQVSLRVHVDNTVYTETSWDIIKARFIPYCKDVWMNLCALWQIYDLLTIGETEVLKRFLDSHQPSPYEPYPWYPNVVSTSLKHNPLFVLGLRAGMLVICFSGLAMILVWCNRLLRKRYVPALIPLGAIASLATHGHFFLTALAQAGLPRYSFDLWPAIVLVGIIIMELGFQKWKGHML